MNCDKCKAEMIKGQTNGAWWMKDDHQYNNFANKETVCAFKCPKCGKIELTTLCDNV